MRILLSAFLNSFTVTEHAFFWIAVISSVLFLFELCSALFFEGRLYYAQRPPLSVKSVTAFPALGGWCAFVTAKSVSNVWLPLLIFLMTGTLATLLTEMLLRRYEGKGRKKQDGKKSDADAVVLLAVPPKNKGKGKVRLLLGEEYGVLDAVTEEETTIPAGTPVRIVLYQKDYVVVSRLERAMIGKAESPARKETGTEGAPEMKAEP